MGNLGYSFTPGLANRFRSAANGTGSQLPTNASQALQVLSLHLPQTLEGQAPAPDSLLRGSGGLTPDTAVRAQTSGLMSPSAPASSAPPSGSPSLDPAPLSIATPQMTSLTSAALAGGPSSSPSSMLPALIGAGGGPFGGSAGTVDTGPTTTSPGATNFQFTQGRLPDAPSGPALPNPNQSGGGLDSSGLSDFLSAILGG